MSPRHLIFVVLGDLILTLAMLGSFARDPERSEGTPIGRGIFKQGRVKPLSELIPRRGIHDSIIRINASPAQQAIMICHRGSHLESVRPVRSIAV